MRHLLIVGALALGPAAAAAQTYEGGAATVGSQWKGSDSNLAAYVAGGYRVVAVTQQLTASDHGIVNVSAYFLQKEASLVRCNELTLPTPAPPKGKQPRAAARPIAPTVILGCAEAMTPAPVPFSTKAAAGFEAVLPGR